MPLLLSGWEEVARFGWEEERLRAPADFRRSYEPVFVLRRNGTEPGEELRNARFYRRREQAKARPREQQTVKQPGASADRGGEPEQCGV